MTEHRCPTCSKLSAATSDDFRGSAAFFCQRCKTYFGGDPLVEPKRLCSCGKWIFSGRIDAGSAQVVCRRCRVLVQITQSGVKLLETPPGKVKGLHVPSKRPYKRMTDDEFVAMMEDRWRVLNAKRAGERAAIAVGLRFDVFSRDGFACRYCGRSPRHGVLLEADHVVPRSKGGEDTLANLVTACLDCNRGKSAKAVDIAV